ncbi:MAG: metallophosphoesterase [Pseudomonadota bacterium]
MHRKPLRFALLLALAALVPLCSLAASLDGPYVVRGAGGFEAWTVESGEAGARKQARPVAVGQSLEVPAVGSLPAFAVTLRKPAQIASDTITVAASTPLFVVADTHGEFEILVDMLRAHRVVNGKLGWSFGRGHLIVLGDVFDRGANQVEILWLLYELEAQARKAGGAVHLLLGNHEIMALRGDLRYLNAKYAQTSTLLGVETYSQLFDVRSVLGQWLRTRPAVLKLNDSLYLHGGVSPALADRKLTLAEINDGVRAGLNELPPFSPTERERVEFLLGAAGPLWYRGYFPEHGNAPAATMAEIDSMLARFGVRRVFVGHTIVPTITRLYDGKVIAVQVYPAHEADGRDHFEALSIRNGKLLRALPDGNTHPL